MTEEAFAEASRIQVAYAKATDWRPIEPGQCALCGHKSSTPELMTLEEFCEEWRMHSTTFFRLQKKGRAPVTVRWGRKHLITREAMLEWRRTIMGDASRETR